MLWPTTDGPLHMASLHRKAISNVLKWHLLAMAQAKTSHKATYRLLQPTQSLMFDCLQKQPNKCTYCDGQQPAQYEQSSYVASHHCLKTNIKILLDSRHHIADQITTMADE